MLRPPSGRRTRAQIASQLKAAKVSAAKRRKVTARSRDKFTASKMGPISIMQKKTIGEDMRSWGTDRISGSRTRGWTDGVTKERAKTYRRKKK
jgi:hypothetical protein